MNITSIKSQNKRFVGIALAAAIFLFIPLTAMQFTNEVQWSLFDFVVAGILLFSTGSLCELVLRKVSSIKFRIALCLTLLTALFVIWIELAVGIFGTPFSGA